jgi:hypothetical protein
VPVVKILVALITPLTLRLPVIVKFPSTPRSKEPSGRTLKPYPGLTTPSVEVVAGDKPEALTSIVPSTAAAIELPILHHLIRT